MSTPSPEIDLVYENLIINGAVSAHPIQLSSIPEYSAIILTLGVTGSGKSNFIETLSPGNPLHISGNTLQGLTQDVVAYRLEGLKANIWSGIDLYVVDTPGFADYEISELEVVQKVQNWTARLNDRILAFYILFFSPINSPRISGSARQIFQLLKAMRTDETQHSTAVITTYWDTLYRPLARDSAEQRFQRLKAENLVSINSPLLKFENTFASAMSVLNDVLIGTAQGFSGLRATSQDAEALQILINAALSDRIHSLQTALEGVEKELNSTEVQGNYELQQIYLSQQAHISSKLTTFLEEEKGTYLNMEDLPLVGSRPTTRDRDTQVKLPTLHSSSGPLQNIRVPISVCAVRREEVAPYSNLFVLMGPIGSGKSSFIQALAAGGNLGIVGGGLDSVTQNVTVYRLGLKSQWADTSIYLLDTPGFADPNMSESRIVNQLRTWTQTINTGVVLRVIYFHSITDNRMPGTRGKCLDIFQLFCGQGNGYRLALATTMWDQLFKPEQFEKARVRLENLQKDHWKDWISKGSQIMKFWNNFDSAIQILDTMLTGAANATGLQPLSADSEYGQLAFRALVERIENYEQQQINLDVDIAHTEAQGDQQLLAVLLSHRESTQRILTKFLQEYDDFVKDKPQMLQVRDLGRMPLHGPPIVSPTTDLSSGSTSQPAHVDETVPTSTTLVNTPALPINPPSNHESPPPTVSRRNIRHRMWGLTDASHWPLWGNKGRNAKEGSSTS